MSKTRHLPHRITAILLSILLLTSMIALPESAILAYADSSFDYQYNSDGTASITGYTGNDTVISIPSVINGRTVKEIGKDAFKNTNITDVTIPDTVEVLGDSSFSWCRNLSKVTLPSSVKTINHAFSGDSSLKTVSLPENVENLFFAFWGCSGLTEITIPGTVRDLTYSFYNCSSIKTVIIENGVETINSNAFSNCTNLKAVIIPSTVASIDDTAFDNDYQFSIYGDSGSYAETFAMNNDIPFNTEPSFGRIENGFIYKVNADGTASITGYVGTDTVINIPSTIKGRTVTEIYTDAFNKTDITEVTIPDNVVVLGDSSFSWCRNLSKVTLPSSVKTINHAFSGDSSLKTVSLPENVENLFFAFWGCSGLTEITIPGSVRDLTYSFYNCTSLKAVIIENGVEKIDANAFANCTNLTSITIPATVTSIDNTAFDNAGKFSIRGVIGSYAEQYAKNNNITFVPINEPSYEWSDDYSSCTATETSSDVLPNSDSDKNSDTETSTNTSTDDGSTDSEPPVSDDSDTDEYVTNESDYTYETYGDGSNRIRLTGYTGDAKKIRIPDKIDGKVVCDIGAYTFNSSMVESVIVPKTVNLIEKYAFNKCSMLESVYLHGNVTLPYNSSVSTFGGYVRKVSEEPFQDCQSLTLYCPQNADKVVSYAEFNYIPYEFINYSDIYGNDEVEADTDLEEETDVEINTDSQTDAPDVVLPDDDSDKPEAPDVVLPDGDSDKPDIDKEPDSDNPPDVFPPDDKPNIDTNTDWDDNQQPDNPSVTDTDTNTDNDQKPDNPPNVDTDTKPDDKPNPIGMLGDVDGDGEITANDALTILRSSVGMADLTPEQTKLADVDNDGEITANDALAVLRYSVGMADADSPINKPIAA